MNLFWSMLPIYLLGNLHCMGMCGPLAMMLGAHRFRYFYFLGRVCSFTLAGMLAGEAGAVTTLTLKAFHLQAMTSFIFGGIFLTIAISSLMGWNYPGYRRLAMTLEPLNRHLGLLMLKDQPFPSFMFGFFTLLLPCGQTLLVFSACALSGSASVGFWNGFAFSLLTTPSLWLAMHAHKWMQVAKHYYQTILGGAALAVAILAICRGMAEMEWIPHFVLSQQYHLVIY